jgi:hypothetical protein
MLDIHWTITVHVPELTEVGGQLVAGLTSIADALTELETTLEVELTQIADALANVHDPAEVADITTRVTSLRDRIRAIVPDMPQP